MEEQLDPSESKFRLHVPLQTSRSEWLEPPSNRRLKVLGHSCFLNEYNLPQPPPDMQGMPTTVRQYLLFDPLLESEARQLLSELIARMRVLAFQLQVSYEIPNPQWTETSRDIPTHNLAVPALISSHLTPHPVGLNAFSKSTRQAVSVLESILPTCPAISDERILAALDLANATRKETFPRSTFLSWLTIIDSLAIRKDRPADICLWLDEKIQEAESKKYESLSSALRGLKRESHGAAIKKLISRASHALGESQTEVKARQDLATKLYSTRSGLSHSATKVLDPNEVGEARDLSRFLVDAAIRHPCILDD